VNTTYVYQNTRYNSYTIAVAKCKLCGSEIAFVTTITYDL